MSTELSSDGTAVEWATPRAKWGTAARRFNPKSPGQRVGESIVSVLVKESSPLELGVRMSNRRSPIVGADGYEPFRSQRNIRGIGDLCLVMIGCDGMEEARQMLVERE